MAYKTPSLEPPNTGNAEVDELIRTTQHRWKIVESIHPDFFRSTSDILWLKGQLADAVSRQINALEMLANRHKAVDELIAMLRKVVEGR